MYSYKLNNSYTIYVNYNYLNSCIKASRGKSTRSVRQTKSSYGERIPVKAMVDLGSIVRVINLNTQVESTLVLSFADTSCTYGRSISDSSPVGKALMRHCVGETVSADTPSGTVRYKILNIKN